jgi:hypothetical protein
MCLRYIVELLWDDCRLRWYSLFIAQIHSYIRIGEPYVEAAGLNSTLQDRAIIEAMIILAQASHNPVSRCAGGR